MVVVAGIPLRFAGTEFFISELDVHSTGRMFTENVLQHRLAGRKILVTGATGFIGSYLVQQLARLGADVSALGTGLGWRPIVRDLMKEKRVRFLPVRTFWNPSSLRRLRPELRGIDSVVHLFQWKNPRRDVTRIDDAAARQLQQLGKVDVVTPGDTADLDGTDHQIAHWKIERLGVGADQRHAAAAFEIANAFHQSLYAAGR